MKKIFYLTIMESEEGYKRPGRKEPLSVCRCGRGYGFLTGPEAYGKRRNQAAALQIYFAFLPVCLMEEMKKKRLRKRWIRRISEAMQFAQQYLGIRGEDIIFSCRLCALFEREQSLPWELYAVCLRTCRQEDGFSCVNLSLPEECGEERLEEAARILTPYLPRINALVMVGEESESAWRIEDYLYDEYGIVTSYAKRPERDAPWLDLSGQPRPLLAAFASGNRIFHINESEVLNFLDTAVKSGYNTKVN